MKEIFIKKFKTIAKFFAVLSCFMLILLSSCGKSHQCLGNWEGSIGNSQFINLKVNSNGDYSLEIIQKRERYNVSYFGKWEKVADNIIALHSKASHRTPNENSRSDDPQVSIVYGNTTFYLQSDGAFSK